MALSSCVLLAAFLLPLGAVFDTASAAASTSASSPASTCPASNYGQPPAAGMGSTKPSSAEGAMGEEERLMIQFERLMREGAAAQDLAKRLEHMSSVLESLGFREMAADAPYLVASPVLASWPGPLTVFAVPDEVLQASCPGCPRDGRSLVEHVALGDFPYADLSAKSTKKLAAAMVGFCFTSSTSTAAAGASEVVSVNGVKITRPDLYNDGRLVVHAVEVRLAVPPQGSCYKSSSNLLSRTDVLKLFLSMLGNANAMRA